MNSPARVDPKCVHCHCLFSFNWSLFDKPEKRQKEKNKHYLRLRTSAMICYPRCDIKATHLICIHCASLSVVNTKYLPQNCLSNITGLWHVSLITHLNVIKNADYNLLES
jgi:hypothetical protein